MECGQEHLMIPEHLLDADASEKVGPHDPIVVHYFIMTTRNLTMLVISEPQFPISEMRQAFSPVTLQYRILLRDMTV